MWNTGLMALLGVWMVLAPFLLPDRVVEVWNTRIVGALVLALALVPPRAHLWELFVAAATGVWLIGSTFVAPLAAGDGAAWNSIASGLVLLMAGVRATIKTPERAALRLPP